MGKNQEPTSSHDRLKESYENNRIPEDIMERARVFSKFLIILAEGYGFDASKLPKRLLIGDIGCAEGFEIPMLIQTLQEKYQDKQLKLLALDPTDEVTAVQDYLEFFKIDKNIVTIAQATGTQKDIFDRIKENSDERYGLLIFRNPSLHSGGWEPTFLNSIQNLDQNGMIIITCANRIELENVQGILSPFDSQIEIVVHDVTPNPHTHPVHNENYWVLVKKKAQ